MTTGEVLTLAIEVLFGGLFGAAAWRYRQTRTAVSLYLMLMFGPLAALLVVRIIGFVGLGVPELIDRALTLLLLAQPLFALGLAGRLIELPRAALPVAVAAFALTGGPFVVLGAGARTPLIVAAVAVFAVIELAAAAAIHRSAGYRTGAARTRRQVVAWATVLLGVAIVAAGAGAAATPDETMSAWVETLIVLAQLLALASGLGYLLAMLPPERLARAWQATGAYPEVVALLARSDESAIWAQLVAAARRTSGARGVVVVRPALMGPRVLASVGLNAESQAALVDRAFEAHARVRAEHGDHRPDWVAVEPRGGDASALSIRLDRGDPNAPLLVAVSRHPPLFPEDGRAMLEVLLREASILADRAALSEAHERLAADLRVTVEELERASQAKSDFLAGMSHELRTPLNAILGFSDLMRDEVHADGTLHVPPEWAEHIHRGGQHLVGLINDILDLSKVEAGRIDLQPAALDLGALVGESIESVRPLAAHKGHELVADLPAGLVVTADRARIRQVLYNLLSNAIKYTPDEGVIRVEAAEDVDEVRVSVTDTGLGIAPEEQERIFEAFWQSGATNGRSVGTGLGLTLSRRLMEAHGGRLTVESTPGEGSRFTAHLPRRGAAEPPATVAEGPASVPSSAAPAGVRVLVVEDDASTVRLLRTYLEPEGYAITVASSGEAAVELARTEHPDVILLDVLLPDVDGWEVLRQLKSDPATDAIPVVFESVVDEPGVGIALGAADYLVKPIDRRQLLAAVSRVVERRPDEARTARVLAVDDEPADLEIVVATLRGAGYEVEAAASGSAALDLAASSPPDAVICDLIMPPPDGFEVITALREAPATAHIPIIVLTAHDLSDDERERLSHRVVTILAKTVEREELLGWLARVVPAAAP